MSLLQAYMLCLLPLHAILIQAGAVKLGVSDLTLPQFGSVLILTMNFVVIALGLSRIANQRGLRSTLAWAAAVAFVMFLQPLFSFLFTYDPNEWTEYLRLLSWLTIIPVSALALNDEQSVRRLKVSASFSLLIIVLGLVYANVMKVGNTAYDLGHFYLGFFYAETSVSMTVTMLLPLFFLPERGEVRAFPINFVYLALTLLALLIVVLVLKRASIVAFVIGMFAMLGAFAWHKRVAVSRAATLLVFSGFIVLSVAGVGYLAVKNSDIVADRFTDLEKYKESGDVGYLGAGRLYLASYYFDVFLQRPVIAQITGVDLASEVRIEKGRYLYDGVNVPHNDFLEFLLRAGVVGLLVFLGFLGNLVRRAWRLLRNAETSWAAQIASVLVGTVLIYLLFSISGVVLRVFPMTCFAIVVGVALAADLRSPVSSVSTRRRHSLRPEHDAWTLTKTAMTKTAIGSRPKTARRCG